MALSLRAAPAGGGRDGRAAAGPAASAAAPARPPSSLAGAGPHGGADASACTAAGLEPCGALRVLALDTRAPRAAAPEAERRHARSATREAACGRLAALLGCTPRQLALSDMRGQPPRLHWLGPGAAPGPLATLRLSLSHAPGVSLLAWHAHGAVGVDLQAVPHHAGTAELLRTAALYLGDAARQALARQAPGDEFADAFTRRWTLHEARLKCLGQPLCEWTPALGAALASVRAAALVLPAWAGRGRVAAVAWHAAGCRSADRPAPACGLSLGIGIGIGIGIGAAA